MIRQGPIYWLHFGEPEGNYHGSATSAIVEASFRPRAPSGSYSGYEDGSFDP